MSGIGDVAGAPVFADVAGHGPVAEVDLDRGCCAPDLHFLADELVEHRVEVVVQLNVIIDVGRGALDLRELIARRRERLESRLLNLEEEIAAACRLPAEGALGASKEG